MYGIEMNSALILYSAAKLSVFSTLFCVGNVQQQRYSGTPIVYDCSRLDYM